MFAIKGLFKFGEEFPQALPEGVRDGRGGFGDCSRSFREKPCQGEFWNFKWVKWYQKLFGQKLTFRKVCRSIKEYNLDDVYFIKRDLTGFLKKANDAVLWS